MQEKFFILEKVVQSLKKSEERQTLETAASELYVDYANDTELTIFTSSFFSINQ